MVGIAHRSGEGVAICANGAHVVDVTTGDVVRQRLLETEAAIELVHALRKQLPGIRFAVEHRDFAHEPGLAAWNWTPPEGTRVADAVQLLTAPATKLVLRHAGHDPGRGGRRVRDYPNGIPPLQWAGLGVAMGNAHPDVIAVADEVTAANDEDGVALVLERLSG